jgi:hypothetical protein
MLVSQQQQPEFTPITTSSNNNNVVNSSHRPRPTRKRTHLSAAQINSLQASFNNNPLPDAAIRHRLAMQLGITERTVQIWFQNRRAKARKSDFGKMNDGSSQLQSSSSSNSSLHPVISPSSLSSLSSSSSTPRYQATFRSLMTPERFEELQSNSPSSSSQLSSNMTRRRPRSASKPEPKSVDLLSSNNNNNNNNPIRAMSEVIDYRSLDCSTTNHPSIQSQLLTMNEDQSYFVTLPTHLLRIGTWTRFASSNNDSFDLLCTLNKKEVIYQIQSGGQQFRIQFPLTAIHQLSLNNCHSNTDLMMSQLDLHVDPHQLVFSMCLQNNEWVRCGDFSEEKQASQLFIHEIQGDHSLLQQVVVDMMTCIPDLASKFIVSPLLMMDDFTVSPSATPEPFNMGMQSTYYQQHQQYMMDKSMMLQAPFYYPTSSIDHPHHQQQQLYLQQMMLM